MLKKSKKDESIIKDYSSESFFVKLSKFLYFKMVDVYYLFKNGATFNEYGVTLMVGEQGSGKTMAMTEYLERMRKKFPNVVIVTNYGYIHETKEFTDWKDFFEIRNGSDGVIFAIDEIQNEFSKNSWKNFPEELLTEITQQRKQKIKIVSTTQVYEEVAITLRRQAFYVIECMTFAGRWVITNCYKRRDYEKSLNHVDGTKKVRKMYKKTFIQDDYIRSLYNTEKKIERMKRSKFMSKQERGATANG